MAADRPDHQRIWRSEAAFFDRQADRAGARNVAIAPEVLARYRTPTRFWLHKEYRFRLLGDLRGARVLDVGCGLGDNSILLAALGARVTGVDVSERSIAVARRRAEAAGVSAPPTFVCGPLEQVELPPGAFDLVWGDGFLHHVLHDLEGVLARLAGLARPAARFVFSEPVDLVPGLRWLRLRLPVPVDGTPDERPLRARELALVRRYVPDLQVRPFAFLGRLTRFVLARSGYEQAPAARRRLVDALCLADFGLLALPVASRFAGMAVLVGTLGGEGHGSG